MVAKLWREVVIKTKNDKVREIEVNMGFFSVQTMSKLKTALAKKYRVNSFPSAGDWEEYNRKNRKSLWATYDNGRVVLRLAQVCGQAVSGTCVRYRDGMWLYYRNDEDAKTVMKMLNANKNQKDDL